MATCCTKLNPQFSSHISSCPHISPHTSPHVLMFMMMIMLMLMLIMTMLMMMITIPMMMTIMWQNEDKWPRSSASPSLPTTQRVSECQVLMSR